MCEFCTQHGEGKRWYLQMKNYAKELLAIQLTPEQKAASGFNTRLEWRDNDFAKTIVPAYSGKTPEPTETEEEPAQAQAKVESDEQILARRKIAHFGQLLPIEDVVKVLSLADSITRMPCACRFFYRGLTNQRYCFGLGYDMEHILGKYPDSSASLEVIEKDEAVELMGRFDDEGLIHSIWSTIPPYVSAICNCDGDCAPYRSYFRNKGVPSFFRSEFICEVDPDQCTGCRECMRQCQFGAQFYSSALGKVSISPELCFGCGVCRAACPHGAISLVARAKVREAASIW